jgi:NitT/TauT family transport system substrate-binding protein
MNKSTKIIVGIIVLVAIVGVFSLLKSKNGPATSQLQKVKIAYLPVSQALPLYLGIEKGYFKEAGIDVEPVRFEAPNQIVDALIAGNVDFGSPSTATGITAISQYKNPNSLRFFALNGEAVPDRVGHGLLVKVDSKIPDIKGLKGKKLGIIPGIQFRTLAKHLLFQEGLDSEKDVTLVELALPLQLQALSSGQVDAVLTLEPIRTIGLNQKIAKDLVFAPLNKYIAEPVYGGGGVVRVDFANKNPELTSKVIAVFEKDYK